MSNSQTAMEKSLVDTGEGETRALTRVDAPHPGRYWTGDHSVSIRITIPFVGRSYYLAMVAGTERRNPVRRAEDRKAHPLLSFSNLAVLLAIGLGLWLGIQLIVTAFSALTA